MNEKSMPGVATTLIESGEEQLEEAPASPDVVTNKGPITVLEACEQERNLIVLVRKYPALYDSRHPRFHDDTYREQLWKRITSKLNIELTQCLVTWSELRYRYQRHVRRLRTFHRSAVQRKVPIRRRPCLRHEEELLFLYPHVARFPLQALEESDGEGEGEAAPEVEIVEPPPVVIIDVDLVEDASCFRCTSAERRLIEAVSAYPQLYDSLHPHFANFRHRGLIWSAISNELRDKATKLIKSWLKLQTRYEWEVKQNASKESELCHLMAFMQTHVLRLRGTVCQVSKYLKTGFHEPIENFRSVLALINAMRTMPDLVQLTEDCMQLPIKPPIYDEMWFKVGKAVDVSHERCEVTWLVLRSFHSELTAMRQVGYQLQDKWYFENVLNGIVRLAAARAAKRANNKRPLNGEASCETEQPPAKIKPPEPPRLPPKANGDATSEKAPPPVKVTVPEPPPPLPIAIVYPPAKKKNCSVASKSSGSGTKATTSANAGGSGQTAMRSSAGSSLATSSTTTSPVPDLPLPCFTIPTSMGTVRVSAMNPAKPANPIPLPNALHLLPQRPGLQISVRAKSTTPVAPVPITLPTAMIRAITPSLPPAATVAIPTVTMQRNGSSSVVASIMLRKVQPGAAPVAATATTTARPKVPTLLPKQQEITVPMVRIHQPLVQGEWNDDVGTTQPVLTPAAALAARELGVLSDLGTGRGVGTVGGEAGTAGGTGVGAGTGAGIGAGAGTGARLGTGAGTGAGTRVGAGAAARAGVGTGATGAGTGAGPGVGAGAGTGAAVGARVVAGAGAAGAGAGAAGAGAGAAGVGARMGAGSVVGTAITYPEVATTSSGLRASPKASKPQIIRATGTSLPPVMPPVTTTITIDISSPPPETVETPVTCPETTSATTGTRTEPPAIIADPPVTTASAREASPGIRESSPAPPVITALPPLAREEAPPSVAPEETPSTSKYIPIDYGQSPRGIFINAINVNLVHSPSAGNSLRIWGGGLNCNYHLNMVRAATLIREVMAVPHLHNKNPQIKAQADEFWKIISQKFHMPELALRACWNFLANNMSLFPSIAPMSELMRPFKGGNLKVWEKSNRLFGKFDEISLKYNWMRHKEVIPDLIRHIRQHDHLYWEMRKPRPGELAVAPPLYTEKERQEVWREAKIKFPDLNHHDIWSMFKFAFRTYMEDLERGIENPWPQNWWQALEQLKFLADVRYHPLEPYYYIVHNKILEEVKRCSMFEALTSSDTSDKSKTSALLARVSKEPMPWCSEEAKRLLTGKLSNFGKGNTVASRALETVTVVDLEDDEATPENTREEQEVLESQSEPQSTARVTEPQAEPEPQADPEPQPSPSRSLVKRPPIASGSRPSFTLPTIEAFELTRVLRRYPHTFQRVHTINKRTAWVRVSKELKITVTECRLGLQYALREMRLLKALDPKNLCTMNHKYYRHMDDIFKQVKNKRTLTVRTPEQMNESVTVEPPDELMPQKFIPEINMSTCKPSLVLKNWSSAIGNLPSESQDVLAIKLQYLFAKYAKMSSHNKS